MNEILRSHQEFETDIRRMSLMTIPKPALKRLLQSCEEDHLSYLGKETADQVQGLLHLRWGSIHVEPILEIMRLASKYGNHGDLAIADHPDGRRVALIHHLGLKWSKFWGSYLERLFELGGTQTKPLLSEDSVVFEHLPT